MKRVCPKCHMKKKKRKYLPQTNIPIKGVAHSRIVRPFLVIHDWGFRAFIGIMEKLACGFGAIQIEDVKAPECFKITRELDARLPIRFSTMISTARPQSFWPACTAR